jgi:hypothetical protein
MLNLQNQFLLDKKIILNNWDIAINVEATYVMAAASKTFFAMACSFVSRIC